MNNGKSKPSIPPRPVGYPATKPKQQPNKKGKKLKVKPRDNRVAQVQTRSTWAQSIFNPFSSCSSGIPDDQVTPSGKVSSTYHLRTNPNAWAGTGTTHSFGYLFPPYPAICTLAELTAGGGVLTDVSADGTGISTIYQPANISAITGASGGKLRCTGMGVRITYGGTELNRSATLVAGLIPALYVPNVVASTGTGLSALSALTGGPTVSTSTLRDKMSRSVRARMDKTVELRWMPAGVPNYVSFNVTSPVTTVAAGTTLPPSTDCRWYAAPDGNGVERGQNWLVVFVEGDTTPTGVVNANFYELEVIWHWEAVPDTPTSVSYDLTPSFANPTSLSKTLNLMQLAGIGSTRGLTNDTPTGSGFLRG
jgi:hypothetical protein